MMKKLFKLFLCLLTVFCLGTTLSCKKNNTFDINKKITRYSRDSSSGTRDGFFTAIGFSEAKEDDSLIPGFVKASDNGNMITLIKNDLYGIGYISLASLKSSGLKALNFENVEATLDNVVNGSYKLSRNFNYITKAESDTSHDEWLLIEGFRLFMSSKEGMAIIKSKDGILLSNITDASSFSDLLELEENKEIKELCNRDSSNQIEIKFGGSTSVLKIAKALTDAFSTYCKAFKAVHNHTGSGAAFSGTQGSEKNTINSMHIGFLSRELNANENPLPNTSGTICKDGIVVVVNASNNLIENITSEQLKKIYSTNNILWSEI